MKNLKQRKILYWVSAIAAALLLVVLSRSLTIFSSSPPNSKLRFWNEGDFECKDSSECNPSLNGQPACLVVESSCPTEDGEGESGEYIHNGLCRINATRCLDGFKLLGCRTVLGGEWSWICVD